MRIELWGIKKLKFTLSSAGVRFYLVNILTITGSDFYTTIKYC